MTRKRWLLAPVYSLYAACALGKSPMQGGLDQTTFSPLILFEDGGYAEITHSAAILLCQAHLSPRQTWAHKMSCKTAPR